MLLFYGNFSSREFATNIPFTSYDFLPNDFLPKKVSTQIETKLTNFWQNFV